MFRGTIALHMFFWFAGEVGPAAWLFGVLYLAIYKGLSSDLCSREVDMKVNVWSSLTVSVVETFWAVGASVLAA